MLRADKQAPAGDRVVLAPREAINQTERRLCGSAAVSRPPIAEGLALQSRRAATLLAQDSAGALGSDTASSRVAWVHHRCGHGTTHGFAFELVASQAQHAVDHCLVAHDLARRIGAPGVCTFIAPESGTLDRVVLPDETQVQEFDSRQVAPVGPLSDTGEAILTDAVRAFRRTSELTGRSLAPVTVSGAEDADLALVTGGGSMAALRPLATALDRAGVRCRVVCVHLVRPFPVDALSHAVEGTKRLLLIPSGDGFLETARRALVRGGRTSIPVLGEPLDGDATIESAFRLLGLPVAAAGGPEAGPRAPGLAATVRPSGDWAERFLLDAAARIAGGGDPPLALVGDLLIVGPRPPHDGASSHADVALCAHPAYLETTGLLNRMRSGSSVILASTGPLPDRWWNRLEPETRSLVLERDLQLYWLDLSAVNTDLCDPDAVRTVLLNGLLARCTETLSATNGGPPASMSLLDAAAFESERLAREPDFKAESESLPRMPSAPGEPEDKAWIDAAREFLLTGEGAHSGAEPTLAEPLLPVVLDALDSPTAEVSRYPVFVHAGHEGGAAVATPFESIVSETVAKLEAEGQSVDFVGRHVGRFSDALGRVMGRMRGYADPDPLIAKALLEFERGFDVSEAGLAGLRSESEALRQKLLSGEPGSTLVGLNDQALPCLHAAAVRRERRGRWAPLRDEIASLAHRLEEMLSIDDGRAPERLSPDALESTLGAEAGSFFDPQQLATHLKRRRGPGRLPELRRERIEQTLATLRSGLIDHANTDVVLVHPGPGPTFDEMPGVREIVHPRGLGVAIGLFDGLAARYADLFRAVRVARLEVDEAYDRELHDEPLARFGWQALTEDELLSLPRLVVLETDARLRGAGLGAFSELLRAGRPVHVLVSHSTSEFRTTGSWQGLVGFHPGLGYVAVAHREAFVLESTLLSPERLLRGLAKMATSLRPGVALVAVPAWDAPVAPWLQLQAAEHGRAIPGFIYDPEAGPHWAERFRLDGNPQPREPWPVVRVPHLDAGGEATLLDQKFTFAHAVALDPAYRRHFRILPDEAWSSEQMELSDYLAAHAPAVARRIPFIWVVREGRLARALVTRELAYAARDRLRAWHILQELAGTGNEYARRAAETARIDADTQAEIRGKVAELAHVGRLEQAREDAVRAAMQRLARRLVGVEAGPPLAPATASVAVETESMAAARETAEVRSGEIPQAEPAAEPVPQPAMIEKAYIDSALCTSCSDCININPQLFKYDANKQAFINDVKLGTYAQLVKAAEKCPARCIHPGLPVAGDETANEALRARAAKFN